MIKFVLLQNRQGKTRMAKWYVSSYKQKEKQRIIREIGHIVNTRDKDSCNFVEWREDVIVYKRYASLYFILCLDSRENEILAMEMIHFYVEILDSYFGNVCELDLIFNFDKAHYICDEMFLAGELHETSKREALKALRTQEEIEERIREDRKKNSKKSTNQFF